jgi:hypothetical protein
MMVFFPPSLFFFLYLLYFSSAIRAQRWCFPTNSIQRSFLCIFIYFIFFFLFFYDDVQAEESAIKAVRGASDESDVHKEVNKVLSEVGILPVSDVVQKISSLSSSALGDGGDNHGDGGASGGPLEANSRLNIPRQCVRFCISISSHFLTRAVFGICISRFSTSPARPVRDSHEHHF